MHVVSKTKHAQMHIFSSQLQREVKNERKKSEMDKYHTENIVKNMFCQA